MELRYGQLSDNGSIMSSPSSPVYTENPTEDMYSPSSVLSSMSTGRPVNASPTFDLHTKKNQPRKLFKIIQNILKNTPKLFLHPNLVIEAANYMRRNDNRIALQNLVVFVRKCWKKKRSGSINQAVFEKQFADFIEIFELKRQLLDCLETMQRNGTRIITYPQDVAQAIKTFFENRNTERLQKLAEFLFPLHLQIQPEESANQAAFEAVFGIHLQQPLSDAAKYMKKKPKMPNLYIN